MAQTTAADVDAQIPEVWSDDLFAQAENQTYWHRYEGEEGSSMPIIRRDQLEGAEAGDSVRVDLVLALTGAGQTSELASVEGNEEALKFRQSVLTVTELSHGVRWTKKGKILINHRMRETAKNQLAKWLAGKLDDRLFNELSGNGVTTMPTASKWAAGTATSRATVADTNAGGRLTLDTLTELKAYAQTDLKIEPIRIDEDDNEYFLFTAHPYAIMQLKRDDVKWAQAQREAQVRGRDNPLFTGDAAVWDGVIIKPSNRVPRSSNGAIQVADNIFSGAQAASRAFAYYPDWTEEYFDYGRKQGIATYCLVGEGLNVFDLTAAGGAAAADKSAIGAMVVYTAAVAPSAP